MLNPVPENTEIRVNYLVDVYAQASTVTSNQVRNTGPESPEISLYRRASDRVPSDNDEISALAATIVGRQTNLYQKARLIYNWLLANINIEAGNTETTALQTLEFKAGGSYGAALLYCALCRAAGLAAAPLAGVLVDRYPETTQHYWAQVWLPNFGWLPVDVALGQSQDSQYYFGSVDSSRIAFTLGETTLKAMEPEGHTGTRLPSYALQHIWEESYGNLNYSSLWSPISITGVFAQ
jgi:transglutaminase/protease-like cytokinesis protein 3